MSSNTTVSIGIKSTADLSGFKDAASSAEGLKKTLSGVFEETKKFNTSAINLAAFTTVVDQTQRALQQLQVGVSSLTQAWAVQQTAETQLETVMRQRMAATDEDIQSIKSLTAAQQELGVIGDEVQLSGAQQIATFVTHKETLSQLIPAMNNLLAQQKGLNATNQDAVSIGNLIGKAMQGQAAALRRVGITFNESQEYMLKYGNESQRAAMLAQIITDNVGDMNARLAATDSGKQKQLENTLGDIKEDLGKMLTGVEPFISIAASATIATGGVLKMIAGVKAAGLAISAFAKRTQLASVITALFSKTSTTTTATTGAMAGSMNVGTVATYGLTTALRTLLISTGVGAAIVALSMGISYFVGKATDAKAATNDLNDGLDKTDATAQKMSQHVDEERTRIAQLTTQLDINIAKLKEFKGTKEEEKKIVKQMNETYGTTMGYFRSVSDWYKALTANSKAYVEQMTNEIRVRRLANQLADLKEEEDQILYNEDGTRKKFSKRGNPNKVPEKIQADHKVKRDRYYSIYENTPGELIPQFEDKEYDNYLSKTSDHYIATQRLKENKRKQNQITNEIKKLNTTPLKQFTITGSKNEPTSTTNDKQVRVLTEEEKISNQIKKNNEDYIKADLQKQIAIRKENEALNKRLETIKLAKQEAELPLKATSLKDFDKALLILNERLKTATNKDQIKDIAQQIEAISKEKEKLENNTKIAPNIEAIKTYKDLANAVSYYTDRLNEAATAKERAEAKSSLNELKNKGKQLDSEKFNNFTPNTIQDYEEAISYYTALQKEQGVADVAITQQKIDRLNEERQVMQDIAQISKTLDLDKALKGLQGKDIILTLKTKGLSDVKEQIQLINSLLSKGKGVLTDEQQATLKEALTNFKGYDNQIQATNANQGLLQNSLASTAELLRNMSSLTKDSTAGWLSYGSQVLSTIAQVIPQMLQLMGVNISSAFAGAINNSQMLPPPFNIIALAADTAAVAAAVANIPKFAEGGVVFGKTIGMMGEYAGASTNPEIIAPLDRLKKLIEPRTSTLSGDVRFVIKGRELVGVLNNERKITSLSH